MSTTMMRLYRETTSLNRICLASLALGAVVAPMTATAENTMQLPSVVVEADRTDTGYTVKNASSPKFTQPLRDTPQTVTVIPQEVMQERAATSLRDVLRNVTGISLAAGEGGTPNGDNLTLRGFNARTDIFVDNMRDIGGYFRDPFNMEQVEVFKGPSSAQTGRGSTGGSINLVSKAPTLKAAQSASLGFGTDNTKRVTADVNQPIPGLQGAALRLNLMAHDADVAGRDIAENSRWAIAPSLAFGLGTPTRVTLSYLHQTEDNLPDYGHPYVNGRPAPVDRENFYGLKNLDYEDVMVDMLTAKVEHDFNDSLTLRNQLRYGHYDRDSIATPAATPNLLTNTVTRNPKSRDSIDTLLLNQLDVTAKFATGAVNHTLVSGMEIGQETSENTAKTFAAVPGTSLLNPNPYQPFTGTITRGATTDTEANTLALYAIDTIALNKQWDITGGLRWDRFDADTSLTTGQNFSNVDNMLSWKGAVTYKPRENGSVYLAYGTSFNPSAETLALSASNANLEPEESRSYELGTKWDLLDKRLAVTGAVFRTEKTNGRTSESSTSITVLEGEQKVDGFEIGATGQITKAWQVFAGYTFLDSKIESSRNPAEIGKEVANVPPHTFSLWTTYELPINVQIGGGTQYVGSRYGNNTNATEAPSYWRFDAMAAYHVTENVDVQLNIFNLADEYYYESVHGSHVVPGAGRTAMLTTSVKF